MATLKGTWRFNDVLSAANGELVQYIDFTGTADVGGASQTFSCSYIRAYSYTTSFISLSYYVIEMQYPLIVCEGDVGTDSWKTNNYGEGIKTIDFGTEPQPVSDEFYAWFTENATEQREISGKWKINGTIDVIPYETLRLTYNFHSVAYLSEHGVDIAPMDIFSPIMDKMITVYRVAPPNTFLETYESDGTPNLVQVAYIGCTVDGNDVPCIYCPIEAIPNLEFDFGESQRISKLTYDWIVKNAKPEAATITYNGSTIASLFGGQSATLKCEGMKMESDVVVEAAEMPEVEVVEEFDGTITIS